MIVPCSNVHCSTYESTLIVQYNSVPDFLMLLPGSAFTVLNKPALELLALLADKRVAIAPEPVVMLFLLLKYSTRMQCRQSTKIGAAVLKRGTTGM